MPGPNILPILLLAGGAAVLLSKKKKEDEEEEIEAPPLVPFEEIQELELSRRCDEFLKVLHAPKARAGELPINPVAAEEQIVPLLKQKAQEIIAENGSVNTAEDEDPPVMAIDVLNEIAPACEWDIEVTGDGVVNLMKPDDERAWAIYDAVREMAHTIGYEANQAAGVGVGLVAGERPGVKFIPGEIPQAGFEEAEPARAQFKEKG